MTDYNGRTRTNYFEVKNPEKLKEILQKCSTSQGTAIKLKQMDNHPDYYMFYTEDTLTGYTDEKELQDMQGFLEDLQCCLQKDTACIITEIGSEKMKYFIAVSTVITKDSIDYVDLQQEAVFRARDMLGNKNWETCTDY